MLVRTIDPRKWQLTALFVAVLAVALLVPRDQLSAPSPRTSHDTSKVHAASAPLVFEPNAGQASDGVRFLAHSGGGTLLFSSDGVTLNLPPAAPDKGQQADGGSSVQMRFVGSSSAALLQSSQPLSGKVNYYVGNDPSRWREGLSTYGRLTYGGLYPGIELSYSGAGSLLKGTYTVAAYAEPSAIRWRYEGAKSVSVDSDGALKIQLNDTASTLREEPPVAWQEIDGKRVSVPARYSIAGDGSAGFALGSYNRTYPLTIDPTLSYSSFLGGSGYEESGHLAVDASGAMYLVGTTTSLDFPMVNPAHSRFAGNKDVFVAKLDPTGSYLVYSTYLGGLEATRDSAEGVAVNSSGTVYIAGTTDAIDFPLLSPIQRTEAGATDVFVAALGPLGALTFSTFLGGSLGDQAGAIALDSAGAVYVAGSTDSFDFPTANAYQPYSARGGDGFITKINLQGSAWAYSTYLGGPPDIYNYGGNDSISGIAVDSAGNAYVTGTTTSQAFPVQNPFQPTYGGGQFGDSFVSKLSATGSALVYSTYLGGQDADYATGIAVDNAGSAYATGSTRSYDFPLHNPIDDTLTGGSDTYVTKFTQAGNNLEYSTYLGGNNYDEGVAITLGSAGAASVTGYTESTDFPTVNPIQPALNGGFDVFITTVNPGGTDWSFSTYLGGSSQYGYGESPNSIVVDANSNIYVSGYTGNSDFPVTSNAYQTQLRGVTDSFVAKIGPGSPVPTATASPPTRTPTITNTPSDTPTFTPTALPGCVGTWSVVQHPNSGTLSGVAAISVNDVWVTGPGATLHWDGAQWSYSAVPSVISTTTKITADAPNDVWILGAQGIARWDGATWTPHLFPTPGPYGGAYQFYNISARASNDVYVVGHEETSTDYNPGLIFHWNGTGWGNGPDMLTGTQQKGKRPEGGSIVDQFVNDIYLMRGNESWTVGYETQFPGPQGNGPTFSHCTRVGCGSPGSSTLTDASVIFNAVIAFGDYDVWAAGSNSSGSVIYHFDGAVWRSVPHPGIGSVYDLSGSFPNDIWAAGPSQILHWNGSSWTNAGAPSGAFTISTISSSDAWAVGVNVLHYQDTPLFNDVPRTDPFYPYIQALACRGVISGYAGGAFRPANNTTRGQLCKIVVNAEGWPINTTGAPHFTDVPPTDPFYNYIETAYNRGVISGYADHTFRWGNDVTRGQLSKIIVLAEDWQIDTTGGPHFSDVPADNPFYTFIETAYNHAIISGYSDGTFRPGNNATRGQISKIVFNAVFGQ